MCVCVILNMCVYLIAEMKVLTRHGCDLVRR